MRSYHTALCRSSAWLSDAFFFSLSQRPQWLSGNWLFDPEKSGLIPYDLHIHDLDYIVCQFGKPIDAERQKPTVRANNQLEHYRFLYDYGDKTVCAEASWYNAPIPFTAGFRICFENAVVVYESNQLIAYESGEKEGKILMEEASDNRTTINVSSSIPCKTYTSRGKGFCTQHRVPYDLLEEKVLNTIRSCAQSVVIDPNDVEAKLEKAKHNQEDSQHDTLLAAIARDEDRMLALGKMVTKLYEDRMMGTLSEDNFQMLMKNTQNEQQELEKRLTDEKNQLAGTTAQNYDSSQWIDLISQYTNIEKLDSETLNRLVRQIVVHEDIDEDHVRHIRLEIHFNFQPVPAIDQYDPADQRPYLHPDHSDRYVMAQ